MFVIYFEPTILLTAAVQHTILSALYYEVMNYNISCWNWNYVAKEIVRHLEIWTHW